MEDIKDMGTVRFDWNEEEEVPTLYLFSGSVKSGYPIELYRLETPIALIGWLDHLLEKNWFDQWDAKNMIELVCEKRKWNRHGI